MRTNWLHIVAAVVILVLLSGVTAMAAPGMSREQLPPAGNIIHVVQAGETLYSIARRYGVDPNTIARFNGITNPNLIYVGQQIIIPSSQPASPPPSQPVTGWTVHVVQAGDTMYSIALRYGVDAWTIARANGIANLNLIYVGQRIVIPKAVSPAPSQPQPSAPTVWPGPWSGEYFDNISLSGTAYLTRTDAGINFDWNDGPPAGGMPVNAFSVRWKGTFRFEAGTYRFYAKVDDGVRVYVDGDRVIDGWRDGGLRLYSGDRALAAGDHTIQVEYYDRTQVARIYFWWKAISSVAPPATPIPAATATPSLPSGVWFAEFYNNETLTGQPVAKRYDSAISFDWGTQSPLPEVWQDGFSIRWTTKIHLKTDHYRFCAMSDDGVRIWIGGKLILDAWRASDGSSPICVEHWAETGNYDAKVEYYEHGGNALIHVWWEPH